MRPMRLLPKKRNVTAYCDFCGKSDDEAAKMIDGNHAFICGECVDAARKLIQPQLALVKQS